MWITSEVRDKWHQEFEWEAVYEHMCLVLAILLQGMNGIRSCVDLASSDHNQNEHNLHGCNCLILQGPNDSLSYGWCLTAGLQKIYPPPPLSHTHTHTHTHIETVLLLQGMNGSQGCSWLIWIIHIPPPPLPRAPFPQTTHIYACNKVVSCDCRG